MTSTLQDSLRRLIAKGKTQEALDELSKCLHSTDIGNTIFSLQSRWNLNETANDRGILAHDDYKLERNQITNSLLSVIGKLEDSAGQEMAVKQVQEVIYRIQNVNIHIGDNVSGDKIGGDKVMGDKVMGDKVQGNVTTNNITKVADTIQMGNNSIIQSNSNGSNTMSNSSNTPEQKSLNDNISIYGYLSAVIIIGGVLYFAFTGLTNVKSLLFSAVLVLLVIVVGTFQLKNDERLSETSFSDIMKMILEKIPVLGSIFKKDK